MQTICSRFHASCCFSAFSFLYLASFCLAFFFRFWIFSVHAMRQIYRQALSSLLGWCHRCCPNAKRDKHTHTHSHTHRACLLGPTHAIQHPLRSRAELFCATMDRMRGLKLCWKCHRKIQHDNKGWHKFPPTSCCRCHMSDAMWQADPATAPATAPHSIHIHVPKMAIVDVVVIVVVAVAVIANWSMCAGQVKVAPSALCLVPVGAAPASAPTPSPSASLQLHTHHCSISWDLADCAPRHKLCKLAMEEAVTKDTQRISRNMHNEGSSKRDEQMEQSICI